MSNRITVPVFSGGRVASHATIIAALLVASPAMADPVALWTPNGVPLCTLPDCGGDDPKLCPDGNGGAIVVYQGGSLGSFGDINAHRVTALGERDPGWPIGGVPLDSHHPERQHATDIASDGAGGVFVVWGDFRNLVPGGSRIDLYAQHLLSDGQIAPGWPADGLPICVAPADPESPHVLPDGYGGAMIVWADERYGGGQADIYAMRVSGDGQFYPGWPENGLTIRRAAGFLPEPRVVADGAGGFLVAWRDQRDGGGGDIFAVRMDLDGIPLPGWNAGGNSFVQNQGNLFGMAPDGEGGAFVGVKGGVTTEYGVFDDVYVGRIPSDGQPASGWPTQGLPLATQEASQTGRHVVADGQGGAFFAWVDFEPGREGVVVQRVLADGSFAPGWNPEGARVSSIDDFQLDPHLAPDGQGGVYAVLHINHSFRSYLQHLTAQGTRAPGWPDEGVPLVTLPSDHGQYRPRLLPDGESGVIAAWMDYRNGVPYQIYAQHYRDIDPTPTQLSLVSATAELGRVELRWHQAGLVAEGVVERRTDTDDWATIGRGGFDASGVLVFEDRSVESGTRYGYRVRVADSDGETVSEETWVQVPAAFVLDLAGVTPNPTSGPMSVAFTLPNSSPAALSLLDLSGRRIVTRQVGSLGAGRHRVRLDDSGPIAPGIYWLRLAQAGRVLTTRAVVIQ